MKASVSSGTIVMPPPTPGSPEVLRPAGERRDARPVHAWIYCFLPTGSIDLRFENRPSPDNPKTAMLACFSALAAFMQFNSPVRYGT